jgi:hypothetical protein
VKLTVLLASVTAGELLQRLNRKPVDSVFDGMDTLEHAVNELATNKRAIIKSGKTPFYGYMLSYFFGIV